LDNGLKAQKWIFEKELARASGLVYVGSDQRQNAGSTNNFGENVQQYVVIYRHVERMNGNRWTQRVMTWSPGGR
jgi:hypothetical protein